MPAHMMPKEKKSKKNKIFIVLLIVLIGLFAFTLYKVISTFVAQQLEQQRFGELREMVADDTAESPYDQLFAMNPDMQGWLKIEDTAIDYPVMKTDKEDGEYYLHRDFDGQDSFAGCLFIGNGCDHDSDIFIIYGHNMRNGSMFGGLAEYYDMDYAMAHRYVQYDTRTEHRVYQVFAVFQSKSYSTEDDVFKYYDHVGSMDRESYEEILEQYHDMSVIWMDEQPTYPDQVVLLSTCADYTEDGRLILCAYRVQ